MLVPGDDLALLEEIETVFDVILFNEAVENFVTLGNVYDYLPRAERKDQLNG